MIYSGMNQRRSERFVDLLAVFVMIVAKAFINFIVSKIVCSNVICFVALLSATPRRHCAWCISYIINVVLRIPVRFYKKRILILI